MMDNTSIVLLVATASISFAIGRLIMHLRKRKKAAQQRVIDQRAAQALKDLPPGPPSNNKSKRKRQQQDAERAQADSNR